MDGTLVGFKPDGSLALRPHVIKVLRSLKKQGHTLIIWTFGTRPWWREVRARFPILLHYFSEVVTREEIPQTVTTGRGFPEPVKDIRLINADVLVDNDPSHHEWAKRHGLGGRYILVPTFGIG
jgi:beta-phosphoglucomutase-like phosphatase (HAD superfamily)